MIRPILKRVFPQVLVWTAVVALSAVIAIAQNSAPAGSQRTDGQIEMDVVHALDASSALKKDLITAATIQGEVTLSGTVASEASRELAESISAHVPGVTAIHNNLKVGNPQDAQAAQDAQPAAPGQESMPETQQQGNGQTPEPQAYPQLPAPGQGQSQDQGQYPDQGQNQRQYPDQGQYSNQGQNQSPYPPPPPHSRPQYGYPQPQNAPMRPNEPAYEPAKGPVTIPAGTLLQLRTNEPVGTKRATDGTPVQFTVIQDVAFGGVLAIPRGATVHGVVTESKHVGSGQVSGSSVLALTLNSLDLGGQNYGLQTDEFKVKGPNKAGQTVGSAIGGGIIGTIIGCAAGRGMGCAIGAGAGVAAGTAVGAASPGPGVWIPAEARVDFHLAAPVTVNPVSQQEASRLAEGLYQGGPSLYQRGPRPYPYGPRYYGRPYGYGYPYGYPPVYYRPYYTVGGFYYWR